MLERGGCPDQCGSVGWALSREMKGHRFYSQSGHVPGLQPGPWLGPELVILPMLTGCHQALLGYVLIHPSTHPPTTYPPTYSSFCLAYLQILFELLLITRPLGAKLCARGCGCSRHYLSLSRPEGPVKSGNSSTQILPRLMFHIRDAM